MGKLLKMDDCAEKKPDGPRFSLIVSACNVAPYADAMIASIKAQTFPAFEVIAVCEESSDGTPEVLVRAVAGDPRFTLVPMPRSGSASVGRNYGITHAHGEYLVFIDGDDWIESDALRQLNDAIEKYHAPDLVACEYKNRGMLDGGEHPHRNPGRVLSGPDALTEFLLDGSYRSAVWRNIYRREFILRTRLLQACGRRHQDDDWTPKIFCLAESVLVSGILLYDYRKRANSVTTDRSEKSASDAADNIASALDFMRTHPQGPRLTRLLAAWQYRAIAKYYSAWWRELYPRPVRRRELARVMAGRRLFCLSLFFRTGLRDRLFALCRMVLPFAAAEKMHDLIYGGGEK